MNEMERNRKVNNFKSDFWFVRLKDLLQQEACTSRKHFIKLATYWYILIELEGYSEEDVTLNLSQDKDKLKEIMERWNLENFSGFVERVYYIASTKQIKSFIQIVKTSSASDEIKEEIINKVLEKDIIETW